MTRERFGTLPDGHVVDRITLRSTAGLELDVIGLGGIVTSIRAPDRHGRPGEIALGHDSLDPYVAQTAYLGALVGRYANRIAHGQFALDGQTYQLAQNDGPHHLHGGWRGFDKYVWHMEPFTRGGADGLRLSRTSPAAEEHYPGALTATVEYEVSDTGEWRITYDAVSDAPTIVNLTQHTYFNLSGAAIVIDDHVLTMHASHYLPVDAGLIPTGEIRAVSGTPFDFTTGRRVGDALRANAEQLTRAGGFDHNFVLDAEAGVDGASIAARVEEPRSGRVLEVLTRQPGIQFYSGNLLDGTIQGRHGFYGHRTGFCLETQKFPDTPNHPAFGTAVLRPGERYESSTVYRFSAS